MINALEETAAAEAARLIQAGDLVVFPTDTVYGLGADIMNSEAIERIYAIKGRDPNKPIAVLVGDTAQLEQLTPNVMGTAAEYAKAFWPGALTLVIEKRPELPNVLSTSPTIGVRMPAHPFTLALLAQTGPLATTSANLSGSENCITAAEVLAQLDGRVALIIDGGTCPTAVPSTVVDCTGIKPIILRHGAISADLLGL